MEERYIKQNDNEVVHWKKILGLVTNYVFLAVAAIAGMHVCGNFKLLYLVFSESKFGVIYFDYDNQVSH